MGTSPYRCILALRGVLHTTVVFPLFPIGKLSRALWRASQRGRSEEATVFEWRIRGAEGGMPSLGFEADRTNDFKSEKFHPVELGSSPE